MATLLQSLELEWAHPKAQALSRAPLYHQLYAVLRGAIMDGRLIYDDKMPTEDQLAETFSVSRITAKRAMTELAEEDLVRRSRGRGSHVTYQHQHKPLAGPLVGMLESYTDLATHSKARVLSVDMKVPRASIRDELDIGADESVLRIVRVHSNEQGRPYSYYTSWTPRVSEKLFTRERLESTSRLYILRDSGVVFDRVTQTLGAEAASAKVASELNVDTGTPLLSLMRRSFNGDRCVDIVFGFYNPRLFKYAMELNNG